MQGLGTAEEKPLYLTSMDDIIARRPNITRHYLYSFIVEYCIIVL